ncbi:MAG TPA: TIGR01244 family sulfur transferase [Pseudomonadales bacterium]|nr:TIGR01244 family sulfur transferase [Pseudomonadales bacterium]HNC69247.1 TIGR01244 family sulfur transferase [Pseudomonadales bacterium]HND15008.1 TIGR01244 family sulfur transferase [Pseudomonadales bacterium]
MDVRRLTDTIAVSSQISVPEVAEAARLGFHTLINNRPDGEDPGQPSAREIEAAARVAGLEYHHLPVTMGALGARDARAFAALIAQAHAPVLAFCRSGTRSAMLWALTRAGYGDTEQVISVAARAGYDLSGLRPVLEHGI